MNVLFISPHFPPEMENFTRGLSEVGASVYGISDVPEHQLPHHVRECLSGYLQVNYYEELPATDAVLGWAQANGLTFDRVECLWEPFVLLAARIRERMGIPGMSYDTVLAFRDKVLMKEKIEKAKLRTPRSVRVRTAKEVWAAAEKLGYPLCIKPIAGAGSRDTYRLDSAKDIERVLPLLGHVDEGTVEEFIEGEEFTFDAVSIDGHPALYSIMQYHPRPLQARTHEWISPAQIVFRDLSLPRLQEGIKLGLDVLKAMNMGTGFTHMEWFRTDKGEAVFGEIACRSGGGHIVDMINYSNDLDINREWARCVCHGKFEAEISRRYNVAMVFKRAQGHGRICGYEGLDKVRHRCGRSICWENLLPIGAPRRDWIQTLLSDGFIAVRNPDYDETLEMMQYIVRELKLYAQ